MKAIPGYERYIITSTGKIITRDGTVLKPAPNHAGYHRVWLYNEHGRARKRVHVLVCEAFHGPAPSPRHEVLHKDNDRTNNTPGNLRWGTHQENGRDKAEHGTVRGERNPRAKVTDAQVAEIQRLRAEGMKIKLISQLYHISQVHTWRICKGQRKTAHISQHACAG